MKTSETCNSVGFYTFLDNVFALNREQINIFTNEYPVFFCMYASLEDENKLAL